MLTRKQLKDIAAARLKDAEVLFKGKRYDGAVYLCGYVIEITLKARVCRTLKWTGFPATSKEFDGLASFKTHDFDVLLLLCGRESVKTTHLADWSVVKTWKPESRYQPPGGITQTVAHDTIEATRRLLKVI
jgi:hypothetical protein